MIKIAAATVIQRAWRSKRLEQVRKNLIYIINPNLTIPRLGRNCNSGKF